MSTEIERAAREAAVRLQLNRVLSALKIDPWDVLDLPYTATDSESARAYRNLSLQCHPDKVDGSLKEDAQAAFSKLAQAKEDISNGLKHFIIYLSPLFVVTLTIFVVVVVVFLFFQPKKKPSWRCSSPAPKTRSRN
jgi:hypothetical protein